MCSDNCWNFLPFQHPQHLKNALYAQGVCRHYEEGSVGCELQFE